MDYRLNPMESANSASGDQQSAVHSSVADKSEAFDLRFRERFESLIPSIQEHWPEVARHTLEATRGSFDEAVRVIAQQSGLNDPGVREQLTHLLEAATDRTRDLAETLEPLESQLEELLDELNRTLRPKIEKPVRQRPLLAVGVAAGLGVLIGLVLAGGRRS